MIARFTDRVALVTGGASGIGAAIADALAAEGAQVAVLDLTENDTPHHWIRTDVSDRASVEEAVAAVVERFGRLDIVVNNAGIGSQGNVQANDDAEWIRAWDINVVGMARVAAAALPHLRRVEGASITNTASIASTVGLPDRVLYSATKGAVAAMTRAMAADHVRDGIRVNCVAPGTADTPWIGRLLDAADDPAAERNALEARQPHGRLVSAEEVANAVLYLADPRNLSTVGVTLAVDGGMDALRLRPVE
ncbi:SDR family NAD(P)-dependent oxidoreductase [Micrococcus luteus]|uniref:SDR family NAD(P)-dependent oxidoreductase n=1 Tax=Micrococcus luteus TaxID=1270 RepID=UPI000C99ACBC|nr:SDR family oxidoreductase [Micrococcus luteus]AWD25333.1 SDR family oxidoreductase [Micrococcus luteus]MCT1760080.1 SDR family oxidoreductase [Micrococcus luteus]MCV7524002.1 SDR family oxidoreductase [Micrococcus luteus]MCV7697693.1 SDR family oxidoreductase [Micrococcus luteus]MCV7712543.1 SDR family oxidoreductase [Micrococcus luteus]